MDIDMDIDMDIVVDSRRRSPRSPSVQPLV